MKKTVQTLTVHSPELQVLDKESGGYSWVIVREDNGEEIQCVPLRILFEKFFLLERGLVLEVLQNRPAIQVNKHQSYG